MSADDLTFASAVDLAAWIRRRQVSPVEVVEALLRRIERVNPQLVAYMTLTAESASGRIASTPA